MKTAIVSEDEQCCNDAEMAVAATTAANPAQRPATPTARPRLAIRRAWRIEGDARRASSRTEPRSGLG
jgi:hypothetical protein